MHHLVTDGCVFISFSETLHESGSKFGKGSKSELTIHVVVVMDFIDKIVGPRTSGSSSHIREGKNDFPLNRREFWTPCFEVKPELADEWFRLVAISGVDIRNIGFRLLFNNDRRRRCRRRNRWRILYRRRYSRLVAMLDAVGKVLRLKHLVER